MKKTTYLLCLMALVFSFANAQENTSTIPISINSSESNGEIKISPANCFDYYKFQSVQVSMGTSRDSYKPGDEIILDGKLINGNTYPIVDGYVFVRISKKNSNYVQEGNFIIDEFFALEGVALDTKETRNVKFNWKVPENIANGKYRMDFFFSVGKKFNLGGLPFSNEVIIGFADFEVISDNASFISFDRSGTQVNGQKYEHIGNWPVINPNEKVVIVQPIKNIFSQAKEVKINYDLYYWDSLNEKDKISSKEETVNVQADSDQELVYVIPEMKEAVYYIRITAQSEGQKSIVNIRLISPQERARLNYPAITKFPLKKGESFTLFSCFNNGAPTITEGVVEILLTDKAGKEVKKMRYEGQITSQMMADKVEAIADKDYNYLVLLAKVQNKEGVIVDEYRAIYDCKLLNSCVKENLSDSQKNSIAKFYSVKTLISFGIIVLMTIITIFIIIKMIKRRSENKY